MKIPTLENLRHLRTLSILMLSTVVSIAANGAENPSPVIVKAEDDE